MSPFAVVHQPPPTLGAIGFINTLPLYHGLALPAQWQLRYAPPTTLNREVLAGSLQVTPVSSAHYLAHRDELTLLPGISVSSYGGVNSVLFVRQAGWSPARASSAPVVIPVPDDSATSVALLRWLLQHTDALFEGWDPETPVQFQIYPAQAYAEALKTYSCALMIGDHALRWHTEHANNASRWGVVDLATAWVARTSLPMVFAVWVTPTAWFEAAPENQNAAQALIEALVCQREQFDQNPVHQQAVIALAQAQSGLSEQVIAHYLTQSLSFDWTPGHTAFLETFSTVIHPSQSRLFAVPAEAMSVCR